MRVLCCGGGTGGHVYPALAVVSELAARSPSSSVLYVGTEGEIEESLVPRAGVALETVKGGGLHSVGAARFAKNLLSLGRGFLQAWPIVGRFRPDVLFLTGGYASVPVGMAAWLRRKSILVFLPDVEPGRAIKLLSRIATRVAVSVEASVQFLPADKTEVTGYPLRPEFRQARHAGRQRAKTRFGVPQEEKVLLVFGGSRGAQRINRVLGEVLRQALERVHVIHISGTLDAQECRARRDALPSNLQSRYHLFDYMHDIAQALAAADLVVARAGAATLAEFPCFGLPSILVPYPYAWRYQKVNADYMVKHGAAIRLNDEEMEHRLWPTIEALLDDENRLKEMSSNAGALARPEAAARLVDLLARLSGAPRLEGRDTAHVQH